MPKTILVVEDDKAVARMLQDVLEAEGFTVLCERDGEWGLRAFREKQVDLVIVDVLIPKIKGFDLIGKLREVEKGKTIPIIVISGVYRAAMHRERIIGKLGVVEYLDKPVDVDALIDVLHDVFSSAYPDPRVEPPEAPPPPPPAVTDKRSPPPPPSGRSPALPRATSGPPARPLSLPDRGNLEEVPFARLLGALFSARASGVLLLRKSTVKKIVYMRQGIPVFVKSNLLSECLGRIMVAERLITQEECDRSLEKKKTSTKKQGEILVEMGSISPHNLEFALELQMQAKLFEIFSWLEGQYHFIASEEYAGPQVALSLAPTAMIYEGASRTMSADRIERDLARIEHQPAVPARDPTFRYQALELDPRAARLIDRIDGKRTLRALLDDADFDVDDATLLLYALTCTALLEVVGGAAKKAPPSPPPPASSATNEAIVLDDADVVALSTAEINAISELAKVDDGRASAEARLAAAKSVAAAAGEAAAAAAAPPVTSPRIVPPPPPPADPDVPSSGLEESLFGEAATQDGSERLDEKVFERPEPEVSEPPPANGSAFPRAASPDAPQLSMEIRRQVRARLEAEAAKLAAERASARPVPSGPGSSPRKVPSRPKEPISRITAPRLDLERENARTKKELTERLERMERQTHYEVLGVHRRASVEEIRAAHQRVSKESHPERTVPGTTSRENRALAENIYVRINRALETLADPDLRREYDRALNGVMPDDRIAPVLLAERAFARGRQATEQGDLDAAYEAFKEAADHNPNEGAYWAHLAYAAFSRAPKDEQIREQSLAQLDRAAELSPRSEDVFVFRGTIHQKTGSRAEAVRDFEAAVRINSDCLPALRALRTLEPPAARKTGLLSRLTIGGDRS